MTRKVTETEFFKSLVKSDNFNSRAIPAESFATGSNPVPGWPERKGVRKNVKMVDLKDEKNEGLVGETTWDHTFFIKAPYPYVHKLYDEMKESL